MALANNLEKLYGRKPSRTELTNYTKVQTALAGHLGELVVVRLSAYQAPTKQKPNRWVSHFCDTTYEAGLLADEALYFDQPNQKCCLPVKDHAPGIVLTDLSVKPVHGRRDVGNGLSRDFNREVVTDNPEDRRLLTQIELFVGQDSLSAYLARPIMGSVPETHQKIRECLEAVGLDETISGLALNGA